MIGLRGKCEFCPGARIVHADIDDSEFGKIRKPHLALHGDIREILSLLLNHVEKGAQGLDGSDSADKAEVSLQRFLMICSVLPILSEV